VSTDLSHEGSASSGRSTRRHTDSFRGSRIAWRKAHISGRVTRHRLLEGAQACWLLPKQVSNHCFFRTCSMRSLNLWSWRSSKCYLRIQSVPQHYFLFDRPPTVQFDYNDFSPWCTQCPWRYVRVSVYYWWHHSQTEVIETRGPFSKVTELWIKIQDKQTQNTITNFSHSADLNQQFPGRRIGRDP
jgi:hypothetical protein